MVRKYDVNTEEKYTFLVKTQRYTTQMHKHTKITNEVSSHSNRECAQQSVLVNESEPAL